MTALIMRIKRKAFVKKYGEKANELISLEVYEHSSVSMIAKLWLSKNSPIREAEFEWTSIDLTPYKKWIHVPVYQFYRADENSSKKRKE